MLDIHSEKALARLFYIGVPAVSLFVTTGNVTDPVNAPKLLVLGAVGFATFMVVTVRGSNVLWRTQKVGIVLGVCFCLSALSSVLFSKSPLSQNIYGVYGRNTGLLTYLLLLGIFFGALLINQADSFSRIYLGLFVTGVVNVLYCGWVVFFGDFIGWNNPYGNILGLFGNPNFIGAFLGIWISSTFGYFLFRKLATWKLVSVIALVLLALFEVYKSHAVQGVVVTAVGFITVLFFYIRSKFSSLIPLVAYTLMIVSVGIVALLGALQKGPLTEIIYKTSVSLRGAYWRAGLQMGLDHPLTGLGMDSYGDWYRRSRSFNAAHVLPGPNTVSNSAHNVAIDIFSYGGFPLLLSYLGIISLGALAIIRNIRRTRVYDPLFVAIAVAWVGYQLQSIISINQIGLAVWGWLLTGILVSYEYQSSRNAEDQPKVTTGKKYNQVLQSSKTVSSSLIAAIGIVAGLIVATPPFSADSAWFKATNSSNLEEIEKALVPSYLQPQDSFRLVNAVGILENSQLFDLAVSYAVKATNYNPENFDSWFALYSVKNSTYQQKAKALENMKRLDPQNPDVTNR